MKQLTISPFYMLVAAYDSKMPSVTAANFLMELVELPELLAELEECRQQAYAGLNADYGDYMKAVQLVTLAKFHKAKKEEIAKELARIEAQIEALKN